MFDIMENFLNWFVEPKNLLFFVVAQTCIFPFAAVSSNVLNFSSNFISFPMGLFCLTLSARSYFLSRLIVPQTCSLLPSKYNKVRCSNNTYKLVGKTRLIPRGNQYYELARVISHVY